MAQLVECLTSDLSSGLDRRVMSSSPTYLKKKEPLAFHYRTAPPWLVSRDHTWVQMSLQRKRTALLTGTDSWSTWWSTHLGKEPAVRNCGVGSIGTFQRHWGKWLSPSFWRCRQSLAFLGFQMHPSHLCPHVHFAFSSGSVRPCLFLLRTSQRIEGPH